MWIIIGQRVETEPVPAPSTLMKTCGKCGVFTTFEERKLVTTARIYFVDAFKYGAKRVMVCAACEAAFAVKDAEPVDAGQEGTLAGSVIDAAAQGKQLLTSALRKVESNPAVQEHARKAKEETARIGKEVGGALKRWFGPGGP